jgi:biopolymer transport protein ExbB/TolQ
VITKEESSSGAEPKSSTDSVEVNDSGGLLAALYTTGLGIGMFFLFYYLVEQFISNESAFYRLVAVGWVPYVVMGLFFISMAMIIFKMRDLSRNGRSINNIYISRTANLSSSDEIREVRSRITQRSGDLNDTMLGPRIAASLERFQHTHSLKDAEDVLKDEADRAFSSAEASYTLLRVIVWATPIMGFIGTVMGVSQSVGGLSTVLGGDVEDISQITGALTNVTKELAFSFDTTLIALVATVIIMISMTLIEQAEFGLLDRAEEKAARQVLPNLPVKVQALRKGTGREDKE